jgi:hypothetical protein
MGTCMEGGLNGCQRCGHSTAAVLLALASTRTANDSELHINICCSLSGAWHVDSAAARFGEALEKELLKLKLRRSTLGVRFHLRDLLGRGTVTRRDTPAGPAVQLVRH